MNDTIDERFKHVQMRIDYLKAETRSETSLFLKAMERVFTVVNKIEAVTSTKPLEIFYYVPVADNELAVAKNCICLTWLDNNQYPRDFDCSITGRRAILGIDFAQLRIPTNKLPPTLVDRDQLWELGINPLSALRRDWLHLDGDIIWKNGQRVRPTSFPFHWSDRATMATMATQISYADFLENANPHWQQREKNLEGS